jgi:FkbM family methyltransferase
MFDKLAILKNKGYFPDTILDIGAHVGSWTNDMRRIYSECNYVLFDGFPYPELRRFDNDSKVVVKNVILNEKPGKVEWYENISTGDSIFKEKTHHYENCLPSTRFAYDLDTVISEFELCKNVENVFVKIDCQGGEIPILKGASAILKKTDFILLEIPLFGQYNEGVASFSDHIVFMDSIGFAIYDLIDNHYINGFNMQVDALFINKNHAFNRTVNELILLKSNPGQNQKIPGVENRYA